MTGAYGLALGSGSARGIAHIGVLKVLEKYHIPVTGIAGTSIGALIGAHYCAYRSAGKLEELVYDIASRKLTQFMDPTIRGGFLKGKKIETFLSSLFESVSFKNLTIPFAAIATDMYTGNEVVFTGGNLIKSIRASIAIPGMLRPVHYENTLLADGGLSSPIPVRAAHELTTDPIIAVNLDTFTYTPTTHTYIPITRLPLNTVNILRHNLALSSVSTAAYVISPVVPSQFYAWRDFFNPHKVKKYIAEGEKAAEKIIPELQRNMKNEPVNRSLLASILHYLNRG